MGSSNQLINSGRGGHRLSFIQYQKADHPSKTVQNDTSIWANRQALLLSVARFAVCV